MDAQSRLFDIRGQLQRAVDGGADGTYSAEMFARTVLQVIKQIDSALPENFVPNYAPVLIPVKTK